MKRITKIKLSFIQELGGNPAYKIDSLTGEIRVNIGKQFFRAGDVLTVAQAEELAANHRDYLVTSTAN